MIRLTLTTQQRAEYPAALDEVPAGLRGAREGMTWQELASVLTGEPVISDVAAIVAISAAIAGV